MAAITIKTNIAIVTENIRRKLNLLADREYMLRPIAFDVIVLMTERIHGRGEAASGDQIGTYNNQYLKFRQAKHNRSADSKIIVSLTRQLENDWNVIATDKGYGIGFNNVFNAQKARWVEANKDKKIFSLSQSEREFVIERLQQLTADALNS